MFAMLARLPDAIRFFSGLACRKVGMPAVAILALFGTLFFTGRDAIAQGSMGNEHGFANVDEKRLLNADLDPGNWMSYGRSYSEQRFSPLSKINADNAKDLGLAWYHDLDTNRGQEATPIAVDGTLFVSTAWSMVKAFDARSGKLLWSFDPEVRRDWSAKGCCDAINRGVAVWKGKVYVGALDGRLIALNAASGKVVWSVMTVDRSKPYTITGAPRVIKGKVMIGNGGAEFGVRGYVSAYDADTGKLAWRFYTVPGDPAKPFESPALAKAAKTWNGEWWKQGGGGTVWDAMAYDADFGLLYIGVGNGSPWNQKERSPGGGDNLFLSSIVALNAETGEYVWHYQTTPGEEWDFTATQHIVLADLVIDGKLRHVLMQAPKNGFFYVIDRKTGELLSAKNYVPINWATGIDMKTGRPIENPEARYSQTGKPWMGLPGPLGGHNWQPMAYNPKTSLVYIPAQEIGFPYIPDKKFKAKPMGFNVGVDLAAGSMPNDPAIKKAAREGMKGYLLAWDPVNQKEVWRAPHAGPWNGGVLTTAGNLVVQGTISGEFSIYRADHGEKLWSMTAQTAVMGGPIAYEVDGEQYLAVTAGWGGVFALAAGELALLTGQEKNRSRLLVFKLGGKAQLPVVAPESKLVLDPPPRVADAAVAQAGKAHYSRLCGTCHGDAAVSGHVISDLRGSAYLNNSGWFDVVLGGALKARGMASFSQVLDRAQAETIRAYVIERANEDKPAEGGKAQGDVRK